MLKPKIGSRVKVLCMFGDSIYFGEGIVKDYYSHGCIFYMVKEFARVNYNLSQLGERQSFAEQWIELAKDDNALKKVKSFLYKKPLIFKGASTEPFVFR
jgi:hypothetical protein